MTNDELLKELKTEIGWLRNELIRMNSAYEQLKREVGQVRGDVRTIVDRL